MAERRSFYPPSSVLCPPSSVLRRLELAGVEAEPRASVVNGLSCQLLLKLPIGSKRFSFALPTWHQPLRARGRACAVSITRPIPPTASEQGRKQRA
jgi:hypothetical protein